MTRLIDADALKEYIDCGHLRNPCEVCFSELDVVNLIDEQPTIDAVPLSELHELEKERDYWMDMAHSYEQTILRLTISAGEVPVRHGKWIWKGEEGDSRWMCSECKCKEYVPTCNGVPDIWHYCPHCGARMDEE